MGFEEPEQEKALSAPANASHDFHEPVALGSHESVKIHISFDYHWLDYTISHGAGQSLIPKKSALSLFYGIRTICHSRLNIFTHARESYPLTFAPWMKKTFAFSARTASGDTAAANAKSIAAIRRHICHAICLYRIRFISVCR